MVVCTLHLERKMFWTPSEPFLLQHSYRESQGILRSSPVHPCPHYRFKVQDTYSPRQGEEPRSCYTVFSAELAQL